MINLKCSDLGGPESCDEVVGGETFAELGENCKSHVMAMVQAGDQPHLASIERMKNLSPEEQQAEFKSYEEKFAAALKA